MLIDRPEVVEKYLHHAKIPVADQPFRHGSASLTMDSVLCRLRIGVTTQRHHQDADRGGRPDGLRGSLALHPLHQESAGKIAKRISEAVRAKPNLLWFCRVAARYSGFAGSRPDIGVANTANNKPSAIFENLSAIWVTAESRFVVPLQQK